MKLVMLFLALIAYAPDERQLYLVRALEAIRATDEQTLADRIKYLSAMERNKCGSAFRRLRVQCLIEAAARNCRSIKDKEKQEHCNLYSDVIVTNALAEKQMIPEEERFRIMQKNRDYRSALRSELRGMYGSLAAAFRVSSQYNCDPGDSKCLAKAIDAYCLDRADRQNLAWQHCAAGLVWFIGTAR